ncbi:MAG: dethiobiotin synthase [Bacteroidota bacterium]|nr:dethiobiotin synthase [Bacteroidota bacterium]
MRKLFITGIGTDVGKTFVSAIFVECLKADYWKPVQCGSLDNTDTSFVKHMVTSKESVFHPEVYLLKEPISPHAASALEGIEISINSMKIPSTQNILVIEGAGGLMVPLNSVNHVIDLISEFNAEVILVVKHYLGSINHTLLSIDALKYRNIPIAGIVFNGERNQASERVILNYYLFKFVAYVDQETNITSGTLQKYSKKFSTI